MTPESNVAPTQAPVEEEKNLQKHPYAQRGRLGFLKDNPGRPKGSKNHSTRVREMLVATANRDTARIFRQHLRRPRNPSEFVKALDQLICLLGPAKPLVEIDNSKHTHFTVVLDGQQPTA